MSKGSRFLAQVEVAKNSRSSQLRIEFLKRMSEVRNGEQKVHEYLYSKYFMAVRKCIHIFILVEVLSLVRSHGMNPLSISQQFNWSYQLIIVFFCALLEVPFPL